LGPKLTKFGKITQSNGHYAVQSHSGSPLSVELSIEINSTSY